jgi:cytochrome c oxidase cbb3-type subunit II
MKNLPLLFFGILLMLVAPWCGLILGSNVQFGALQPGQLDEDSPFYPQRTPGIAEQGRQVYTQMGCAYCHTQQVRSSTALIELPQSIKGKPGETQDVIFSPDIARGWAKRGSVTRDYIFQDRVLLGTVRNGPDLADVGARDISNPDTDWQYRHLYNPRAVSPGSIMPPFRFLFVTQPIGDTPSPLALHFDPTDPDRPAEGYEVVPTARAIALVAYLRSLNIEYELPEARFSK